MHFQVYKLGDTNTNVKNQVCFFKNNQVWLRYLKSTKFHFHQVRLKRYPKQADTFMTNKSLVM